MIRDLLRYGRTWLRSLPPTALDALRLDTIAGLLAGAYAGCIWTFVTRVARADLHASGVQMGWITAAPAIGYVFATLWARQMEGRAKMPFVWWTWMAARGLFLFTPLFATRNAYIVLVCAAPIIFSVSTPAYTSVMKDIYPDQHRGRLMSLVRVVASASTFVTALVAGRLMDRGFDWKWSFMIGGAFGVSSALVFARIRVPEATDQAQASMSTLEFLRDTADILRRNPGFRWFSASVFIYGFGNIMATTLYPIHQVDAFHIRNTDVANMQNIAAVAQIVGYFFWGSVLDREGPLTAVFAAIVLVCLMAPFYALAHSLVPIYLAAALGGLAFSGIELGYLNSILVLSEPGRAAQYQALHSSLFGIRGSIAPFCAIPLMHALGIRGAFWACFAVMLIGVALQLVSMREHRRDVSRQWAEAAGRQPARAPSHAEPDPTEATL